VRKRPEEEFSQAPVDPARRREKPLFGSTPRGADATPLARRNRNTLRCHAHGAPASGTPKSANSPCIIAHRFATLNVSMASQPGRMFGVSRGQGSLGAWAATYYRSARPCPRAGPCPLSREQGPSVSPMGDVTGAMLTYRPGPRPCSGVPWARHRSCSWRKPRCLDRLNYPWVPRGTPPTAIPGIRPPAVGRRACWNRRPSRLVPSAWRPEAVTPPVR
jgi:hypothetical protein